MRKRRFTCAAMAAGVIASGLVLVGPGAAGAYTQVGLSATTWAYTDARHPFTPHVNEAVDAPVGVWRDSAGHKHVSRSFFTFDLAAFAGAAVPAAEIIASERTVNDCATRNAVELWRTKDFTRPTWLHSPAELELLDATPSAEGCPSARVAWDVRAAVVAALAAGRTTLTVELRLPQQNNRQRVEADPHYGRTFDRGVRLVLQYNRPPGVPTNLSVDSQPCGAQPHFLGFSQPTLSADATDPDAGDVAEFVGVRFAIWPVSDPAQRTELEAIPFPAPTTRSVTVPDGVFIDGQTYQVTATAVDDDGAVSAPSPPCTVVVDLVAPANPPLVSSVQYPPGLVPPGSGGPGIAGDFTFSANGESDIAGYYWGELGASQFVAATTLGGDATVTWTPQTSGPKRLFVASVDRAGHRSPERIYLFLVKSAA